MKDLNKSPLCSLAQRAFAVCRHEVKADVGKEKQKKVKNVRKGFANTKNFSNFTS
ncbi:MAG: hypothetical protein IKP36_03210 [Bacteroidaceae bacterium]|nr:hypothetical protein [Bacteroidaceae bacterium]